MIDILVVGFACLSLAAFVSTKEKPEPVPVKVEKRKK